MACGYVLGSEKHAQHMGSYRIAEYIGQGSTCRVYSGFDEKVRRHVAIKVIPLPALSGRADHSQIDQFRHEAEVHGHLIHPNIVKLYTTYEDRNIFALILELLHGCTLEEFLQQRGTLNPGEILTVSKAILSGLANAHSHHITHLDLKASNIFLSNDGSIKIKDFGLASLHGNQMASHSSSGSQTKGICYDYMAPEKLLGKPGDIRSDLYAFGVLLYRMSSGSLPFSSQSASDFEIMEKQVRETPVPPEQRNPAVPEALSNLIMALLQKNPEARPQHCQQIWGQLRSIATPAPIHPGDGGFSKFHSKPGLSLVKYAGVLEPDSPDIEKANANTLRWVIQNSPVAEKGVAFKAAKLDAATISRLKKAISSIPPLPHIWHLVQAVLDDSDASPADLATVVKSDSVLSAHILSLANSAAFAVSGRELSNVSMAIARIGMENIHGFLMQKLAPDFSRLTHQRRGQGIPIMEEMRHIWLHSQATGKLAASLSSCTPAGSASAMRTFGMMHDIGKLVILHVEDQRNLESLKLNILEGMPGLQAESQSLGYTHVDAGMMLALHWKLPRSLQQFIHFHHKPEHEHPDTWPAEIQTPLLLMHAAHLVIQSIQSANGCADSIWSTEQRGSISGIEKILQNHCLLPLDDASLFQRLCEEYAWIEGTFFQSMAR